MAQRSASEVLGDVEHAWHERPSREGSGQAVLAGGLEKGEALGRHEGRPLKVPGPHTAGVHLPCVYESVAGCQRQLKTAWGGLAVDRKRT